MLFNPKIRKIENNQYGKHSGDFVSWKGIPAYEKYEVEAFEFDFPGIKTQIIDVFPLSEGNFIVILQKTRKTFIHICNLFKTEITSTISFHNFQNPCVWFDQKYKNLYVGYNQTILHFKISLGVGKLPDYKFVKVRQHTIENINRIKEIRATGEYIWLFGDQKQVGVISYKKSTGYDKKNKLIRATIFSKNFFDCINPVLDIYADDEYCYVATDFSFNKLKLTESGIYVADKIVFPYKIREANICKAKDYFVLYGLPQDNVVFILTVNSKNMNDSHVYWPFNIESKKIGQIHTVGSAIYITSGEWPYQTKKYFPMKKEEGHEIESNFTWNKQKVLFGLEVVTNIANVPKENRIACVVSEEESQILCSLDEQTGEVVSRTKLYNLKKCNKLKLFDDNIFLICCNRLVILHGKRI